MLIMRMLVIAVLRTLQWSDCLLCWKCTLDIECFTSGEHFVRPTTGKETVRSICTPYYYWPTYT